MSRLCFDYGHGGNDPGAIYRGRKEANDVLEVGKAVATTIRNHGVTVDEIRSSDSTVNLSERSSYENRNNYDYFISFHRNAFEPEVAKGVETYTYTNCSGKAKELAQKVQASLIDVGFSNRGVKSANFHVLRETKAPAILIEIGFVDNSGDNRIFDDNKDKIVMNISKAILEQLGIVYKEESVGNFNNEKTLYRVMAGSFSIRENADKQVQKLKAAGFDAAIIINYKS